MQNNKAKAAILRESLFKEEQLGNLGIFYRDTAAAYQAKMLQESKELDKLKQSWEKRFEAAEKAKRENNKAFLPSFIDPITNKSMGVYRVLDRFGNRMSFEDILKKDTSKRGNIFAVGQEAKAILERQYSFEDYQTASTSYETKLQQELSALQKRNEEANQKFLLTKKKQLEELEQGSYRQATYTEKPL
jgi:hypothetical protein